MTEIHCRSPGLEFGYTYKRLESATLQEHGDYYHKMAEESGVLKGCHQVLCYEDTERAQRQ